MPRTPKYISELAATLREARMPKPAIRLGELTLNVSPAKGPSGSRPAGWQLLRGVHEYNVTIGGTELPLSIQLYLNPLNHYRLFAFSTTGMLFSLNFTTTVDAGGIVSLSQRIKFSEGRTSDPNAALNIRQAKARLFADVLLRCGIPVTDNLEVEFGTFCSRRRVFLDTTPEQFLGSFISVALLKGHFQGNKGYQFACMPRFDNSFTWRWNSTESVRSKLVPNKKGLLGERAIPLGLRFQVLERDDGRCCSCGRSPTNGVTLHVDHIVPFSTGGLTILSNLQTLCNECNLGKGNRSRKRFLA
ncbi:HNH endonuclease [Cupriavidus sp. DF5525]|uniref:HNH endonuclease n=1 Tax=Cupriavidus sp. DF5525 TaxID=3160989 RepID=UPI0003B0F927|nr:hypothetical protein N234_09745 [Ralstonia pickettii DTP0602]